MLDATILITDGLDEAGLAVLRGRARVEARPGLKGTELLEAVADAEAVIVCNTRVDAAVFNAGRRLKVVGRAGVGFENIDLAEANQHNVTVVNAPLAATQAVAEHTLGLLFSIARSIPQADANLKTGQWTRTGLYGVELGGKTLGLIGMGRIGAAVAGRAAALGMEVLGCDPFRTEEEIRQRGARPAGLAELYAAADFISLHVPFTPETRGLINGQSLGQMKRGVYLVCTARGGLIDETALLGALESGQVAGAALDVFGSEPPGVSALVSHPQVVATPHIAAQTCEAQRRAALDIATEVLAALKGEPLRWKVV
jgi:D-3-phosphoglycerate dehydrogenase